MRGSPRGRMCGNIEASDERRAGESRSAGRSAQRRAQEGAGRARPGVDPDPVHHRAHVDRRGGDGSPVARCASASRGVGGLLGVVRFYLPCTAVVIWLNSLMPLEGGLYQWAKLGFSQTMGFMVAWNLWLYVILFASELGLTVATYLSYALGPSAAWMTTSVWFVSLAAAVAIALLATLAFLGLSLGKWVHNAGGIFMITIFAVLILLPFIGLASGHLQSFHPFRTEMPAFSLFNLNILGKMCVGAFAGFEYMAILAGETHAPASAVKKSVYYAAPVITLFFILGTATVVAYIPRDQIDLIGPLPQVL